MSAIKRRPIGMRHRRYVSHLAFVIAVAVLAACNAAPAASPEHSPIDSPAVLPTVAEGSPPSGSVAPGALPGRIAFAGCVQEECGVFVINSDGTDLALWSRGHFDWNNPAWSPGGQRLAVSRLMCAPDEACVSVIAIVDDDGSVTDLTQSESGANDDYPSWSPDGTRVLFSSTRETSGSFDSNLFTIGIDGSGLNLIDTGGPISMRPNWSPDGSLIVFEGRDAAGDTGLFTLSSDGSGKSAYVSGPDYGGRPDWSPDGRRIGWEGTSDPIRNADGTMAIDTVMVTLNPDGSDLTKLQKGYSISWSPSGDAIAYFDDDGVWISSPTGAQARLIDVVASSVSALDWGPSPRAE